MECEQSVMEWEEVKSAARLIYRVWRGGEDLTWAENTWTALSETGLTTYSNEVERCQVALRFLALADLYYGFCSNYLGEFLEPEFLDWSSELPINAFRLGQLLGQDNELDDEWDADVLFQKALEILVSQASTEIEPILRTGLSGITKNFIALWRSSLAEEKNDPNDEEYVTDNDVLSFNSIQFLSWSSG